jgi:hypothetical protein
MSVPIKAGVVELIFKAPPFVAEACKRQTCVALALVGGVIDRHDQPLVFWALPGEDEKAIVRPIAFPSRFAKR